MPSPTGRLRVRDVTRAATDQSQHSRRLQSMPWWSWILIWSGLALALLVMLGCFGVVLFRKLVRVMNALGELSEQLSVLDQLADRQEDENIPIAVLADPGPLSEAVRVSREKRAERRQARRDSRVTRGKLLVKADAQQFSHLTKRI